MRNSGDAEQIEVGWWPGDARYPRAAFFAYAHPAPRGFETRRCSSAAARWDADAGRVRPRLGRHPRRPDPHASCARVRPLGRAARVHGVRLGPGARRQRRGRSRRAAVPLLDGVDAGDRVPGGARAGVGEQQLVGLVLHAVDLVGGAAGGAEGRRAAAQRLDAAGAGRGGVARRDEPAAGELVALGAGRRRARVPQAPQNAGSCARSTPQMMSAATVVRASESASMPSISPSSEITARCSLTRPKRTSAIAKMRPSSAASGPGTSSSSSLQERSAGALPGSQPGDVQQMRTAVGGQREGDAVVVARRCRGARPCGRRRDRPRRRRCAERTPRVAVRRHAGAYAWPCVATGSTASTAPSKLSDPPMPSPSSCPRRVRTRPAYAP